MTIRLHNALSRRKEAFEPIDPRNVRMYVCGPTVYDRAHLGNARAVVVFDVLFRLLRHEFGANHVTYARNFTDVDDKINARAAATGRGIRAITDETIGWFHEDMDALGNLRPTHEPRATEWIGAMVAMIEGLVAKGHAYEAKGHVLFRVRSYAEYGALSGRSVDDMMAGARVEVAPFKEDPLDFVLWKPSDEATPGWDSPWGRGRPGWHIECSAMARELLGGDFDIHGGGLDLQFPHHENEIAQSRCAHPKEGFARVWMHNEMLLVDGKKMAKSAGNFFTVRDLLDQGVPGEVIRFLLLSNHYRAPLDWTNEKVEASKRTMAKFYERLRNSYLSLTDFDWDADLKDEMYNPDVEVVHLLANDLNLAGVIARLHELSDDPDAARDFDNVRKLLGSMVLLGLIGSRSSVDLIAGWGMSYAGVLPRAVESKIAQLIGLRQDARSRQDFNSADRIRRGLIAAGVEVKDSSEGPRFAILADFDAAKLEHVE